VTAEGPLEAHTAPGAGAVRAALFDLDGTLYRPEDYPEYFRSMDLVTGERVRALYGAASAREGFERLEADRIRQGLPSKSAALQVLHGISLSDMNRWRERHTRPEDHLRRDPRLGATLQGLSERILLGIGTNNAPGLARRILAALGLGPELFAFVQTSEDCGAAKPELRFFEAACERFGLPPQAVLSVGDTPAQDLEPAARLGMPVLLVRAMADVYRLHEVPPEAWRG
jgi:putative hydrolase of the HAD superfamily